MSAKESRPSERVLLDSRGVRLTQRSLEAGGRTYPLADVREVHVTREGPRLFLSVLIGFGLAFSLPALLALLHVVNGSVEEHVERVLVLAAIILFISMARLFLAQDKYWLVLETSEGRTKAYVSTDQEFVTALVDLVSRALPVPSDEPGLPPRDAPAILAPDRARLDDGDRR